VKATGMAGIVQAAAHAPGDPPTVPAARPSQPVSTDDAVESEPTELAETQGAVAKTFAPGTVLLRVIRQRDEEGQECFRLELQTDTYLGSTGTPQELRNQRRPHITLAAAALGQKWRDILPALKAWSHNKHALHEWLTALHTRYGAALRLVVWDDTGFEIPWELFSHRSVGARHGWLGADVELIRWTSPSTGQRADMTCHGPILSFVDPTFQPVDAAFNSWLYEKLGSMSDLLTSLNQSGRSVGLVHVWAHGLAGNDGLNAMLGGMPMDHIGWQTLEALRAHRTLVLLNACSGAQLMDDDRFGERATRSFAQLFLDKGALGVIATVGQVGADFSVNLLNYLLRHAARGEQSVSAALLGFRAALAQKLPETPFGQDSDEYLLQKFIYGFMYQYIGHFDTVLRLSPREPAG
jgi:hypothetical protein